jgi:sugar transferase (PEP-CTERM/EpsH1 system associated)
VRNIGGGMTQAPPLVLHVIHHLFTGGMENGLVNLVNRMPADRFRHAVACIEDYSDFRKRIDRADVEIVALNRSRIGHWRMRERLYRLCRRLRPAVLHTRNMSALDALLPARIAGVPRCVHGEHGWDVADLRGERRRSVLLRRLHAPMIDHYVTVSRDLERYLMKRVGVSPARITPICNGVDTVRFAPRNGRSVDVMPQALRGDDLVVVGTVARMQAVKDHATLVRAVAMLVAESPALASRLRLAIVGDGPLLEPTRALVSSLGLDAQAWLPGARDDVPDILQAFDLFVLPSLAEGISNTLLEAMASGLPVLASAVGGNSEIVDDGHWGRLFAAGDVAGLAGLLRSYVADERMRRAQGAAARRAAVERFSLDTMVNRYQTLYEGLCAPERRQAA